MGHRAMEWLSSGCSVGAPLPEQVYELRAAAGQRSGHCSPIPMRAPDRAICHFLYLADLDLVVRSPFGVTLMRLS